MRPGAHDDLMRLTTREPAKYQFVFPFRLIGKNIPGSRISLHMWGSFGHSSLLSGNTNQGHESTIGWSASVTRYGESPMISCFSWQNLQVRRFRDKAFFVVPRRTFWNSVTSVRLCCNIMQLRHLWKRAKFPFHGCEKEALSDKRLCFFFSLVIAMITASKGIVSSDS